METDMSIMDSLSEKSQMRVAGSDDNKEPEIKIIDESREKLVYNVSDRPPIHLTIFFALQQSLLALAGNLSVAVFVAEVACVSEFSDIKTELLSSTLFMSGVTTLLMSLFGIGLPLFQGAASDYIIPLLAIQMVDKTVCDVTLPGTSTMNQTENVLGFTTVNSIFNATSAESDLIDMKRMLALRKLREFQGSLILAGLIHFLVGFTGSVGYLLRFIGPVTVVPTVLLTGVYMCRAIQKFCRAHWGVTFITACTSLFLSLYVGHKKMPIPLWSRKKGFYILWYPLHEVFSILIGMLLGWFVSYILTITGNLTDDPSKAEFFARTDARAGVIETAQWFRIPYPNQFGPPSFDVGVFIAFTIGSIVSIIDSIGDYYACAKICQVPPPPIHGVNRGIAVEGLCSMLSGAIGCGHATSTYGGNIGAMGVTKVTSRVVFLGAGIIFIVFGVIGKISAVFITIPYAVLGGAMIVMFGMFNGIVLSNLQALSLSSTRNLAIIGNGLLFGLMIPYWLEANPDDISTGNPETDHILKTLLSNPNFCCGIVACILDNTVPGTKEERGITTWQTTFENEEDVSDNLRKYNEGPQLYEPAIPRKWLSAKIFKYLPIFPYKARDSKL